MKVFDYYNNIFQHHYQEYATAEEARKHYAPNIPFLDTPDYVFEGWGYDPDAEGDERFIKPTPPKGWLYDDATGCMYPENELPPSQQPTMSELMEMFAAVERGLSE